MGVDAEAYKWYYLVDVPNIPLVLADNYMCLWFTYFCKVVHNA